MVKKRDRILDPEWQANYDKDVAIVALAKQAGLSDDAIAHADYSLQTFFDLIIKQCVRVAEESGNVYSGENKEHIGAQFAAHAIRTYGKTIGQK